MKKGAKQKVERCCDTFAIYWNKDVIYPASNLKTGEQVLLMSVTSRTKDIIPPAVIMKFCIECGAKK